MSWDYNPVFAVKFAPDIVVLCHCSILYYDSNCQGANPNAGNIIFGGGDSLCQGGEYMNVVVQGVCDDGSSADVEIARCIPSIPDDIEFNTADSATVSLSLNPIIYNAMTHEGDGLPAYTIRLGDYDLTTNMRLNVTTGEYQAVTEPTPEA